MADLSVGGLTLENPVPLAIFSVVSSYWKHRDSSILVISTKEHLQVKADLTVDKAIWMSSSTRLDFTFQHQHFLLII
ncbi:hypothetical protein AB3S75_032844 [Citrus x aurantiifolia]